MCASPGQPGNELLRGLSLLRDYGFVFVSGVPQTMEATEAACRRFGKLQVQNRQGLCLVLCLLPMRADKCIGCCSVQVSVYGTGMWRTEIKPPDDASYTDTVRT
jgi:hypothetical protein